MRPVSASLLCALCVLLLAACGGGGDSKAKDKQAISDALRTGFTSTDVDVVCGSAVTMSFVTRVYGDPATCRKAQTPKPGDKPTTGVTTSQITITSDHASAHVELSGGDSNGTTGTVEVLKDGGDWKINDLDDDLLRSQLQVTVNGLPESELPAASKTCVLQQVNGLGDADLQRLAYGAIAESDAAQQQLTGYITKCAQQSGQSSDQTSTDDSASSGGKPSFLRRKFEQGLTASARRDGASASTISCVKRKLRQTISDDEIVKAVEDHGNGKKLPAELTAKTAEAIAGCR